MPYKLNLQMPNRSLLLMVNCSLGFKKQSKSSKHIATVVSLKRDYKNPIIIIMLTVQMNSC